MGLRPCRLGVVIAVLGVFLRFERASRPLRKGSDVPLSFQREFKNFRSQNSIHRVRGGIRTTRGELSDSEKESEDRPKRTGGGWEGGEDVPLTWKTVHPEVWSWGDSDIPSDPKVLNALFHAPASMGLGQNGGQWLGIGRRRRKLRAALHWAPKLGEKVQVFSLKYGKWLVGRVIDGIDGPEEDEALLKGYYTVQMERPRRGIKLVDKRRRDI
eukprot:1366599-Amorphochlora_amoeboformis.AAC.2